MNRIFSAFTAILLTLSLTACGATKDNTAAPADDPSAAASQDVTVRIGLTGTFNEDIWAPAAEELAQEGIHLEFVQFSNFSLPNDALNSGDIDLNAFQHHAFLENEIANYGYDLTAIGDTYVVAMNVYSDKINDLSELKDGDKIAIDIPNYSLKLLVSDEEMEERKKTMKIREPKKLTGYLKRYAKNVSSADKGAIVE